LGYEVLSTYPTSLNLEWCMELWSLKVSRPAKVMILRAMLNRLSN